MLDIFFSILPLLALIIIGYVAGKAYKLSTTQYGYMVAFTLSPLVSFGAILQLEFKSEYLLLPVIVAFICIIVTFISYKIAKLYLSGQVPNLAGMGVAGGNTGFFGLPVFLLFMPMETLGVYLLANLGMQIAEASFGYYIGARGECSVKESLVKLLKMPPLWGAFIGIIFNIFGFEMPKIMHEYWHKILNCWLVMGMMMIGIALAACASLKPDIKFCTHMMCIRFILWPFLAVCVVLVDYYGLHILSPEIYFILSVFSMVPLAGNSVALSATLGLHPDKMAFAVVLSTILAALIVPLMIGNIYTLIF